jgi:hypothetical protein
LSTTVTVCVEVAVLLFPSVAVQVTVFGPFTKLAGERVTVTVVQSEALGAVERTGIGTNSRVCTTLIAVKVAIVELDCPSYSLC